MQSYWQIEGRIAGKTKSKWEPRGARLEGTVNLQELENYRKNFRNWEFRIVSYTVKKEIFE